MSAGHSIGVHWADGAWLVVVFEDHEYADVAQEETFERLYAGYEDAVERVYVNARIGLFEAGDRAGPDEELERQCDVAARRVLGSQYNTILGPPSREALEARNAGQHFSAVSDIHREITGLGMPQHGFHTAEAIDQMERFLRERPDLVDESEVPYLVKSHPEVCFRALAGDPLTHARETAAGVAERIHALEDVLERPRDVVFEICHDLTAVEESDFDVEIAVEDVLAGLVLALAASAPADELHRLPADGAETDSLGLPMQVVYRAEEPISG